MVVMSTHARPGNLCVLRYHPSQGPFEYYSTDDLIFMPTTRRLLFGGLSALSLSKKGTITRAMRKVFQPNALSVPTFLSESISGHFFKIFGPFIEKTILPLIAVAATNTIVQFLLALVGLFKTSEGFTRGVFIAQIVCHLVHLLTTIALVSNAELPTIDQSILNDYAEKFLFTDCNLTFCDDESFRKNGISFPDVAAFMEGSLAGIISLVLTFAIVGNVMTFDSLNSMFLLFRNIKGVSKGVAETTSFVTNTVMSFFVSSETRLATSLNAMVKEASDLVTMPIVDLLSSERHLQALSTYTERQAKLLSEITKKGESYAGLVFRLNNFNVKIDERLALVRNNEHRQDRPYTQGLLLFGEKNAGKTFMTPYLAKALSAKLHYPSDKVYPIGINSTNKYFLTIGDERICEVQDFLRENESDKVAPLIHNILSTSATEAQGAAVELKQQFMRFNLLIATTNLNFDEANLHLPFKNTTVKQAFWDRFMRLRVTNSQPKDRIQNFTTLSDGEPSFDHLLFDLEVVTSDGLASVVAKKDLTYEQVIDSVGLRMRGAEHEFLQRTLTRLQKDHQLSDTTKQEAIDAVESRIRFLRSLTFTDHFDFDPTTLPAGTPAPAPRKNHQTRWVNRTQVFPKNGRARTFFAVRFQGPGETGKTYRASELANQFSQLYGFRIHEVEENSPDVPDFPTIFLYDDIVQQSNYPWLLRYLNSTHPESIHIFCSNKIFEKSVPYLNRALAFVSDTPTEAVWYTDIPQSVSGLSRRMGFVGLHTDGSIVSPHNGATFTTFSTTRAYLDGTDKTIGNSEILELSTSRYAAFLNQGKRLVEIFAAPPIKTYDFCLTAPNIEALRSVLQSKEKILQSYMDQCEGVAFKISKKLVDHHSRLQLEKFMVTEKTTIHDFKTNFPCFVRELRKISPDLDAKIVIDTTVLAIVDNHLYTNISMETDIKVEKYKVPFGETYYVCTFADTTTTHTVADLVDRLKPYDPAVHGEPIRHLQLKNYVLANMTDPDLDLHREVEQHKEAATITAKEMATAFMKTPKGKLYMGLAVGLIGLLGLGIFLAFVYKFLMKGTPEAVKPNAFATLKEYTEFCRDLDRYHDAGDSADAYNDYREWAQKNPDRDNQIRTYSGRLNNQAQHASHDRDLYKSRGAMKHNGINTAQLDPMNKDIMNMIVRINGSFDAYGLCIGRDEILCPAHLTHASMVVTDITDDGIFVGEGSLVARDPARDLAIIRISSANLYNNPKRKLWVPKPKFEKFVSGKYELPNTSYFVNPVNRSEVIITFGSTAAQGPVRFLKDDTFNPTAPTITFSSFGGVDHNAIFADGDCGKPLVVLENGSPKIQGIHIGKNSTAGCFSPCSLEILEELRTMVKRNGQTPDIIFTTNIDIEGRKLETYIDPYIQRVIDEAAKEEHHDPDTDVVYLGKTKHLARGNLDKRDWKFLGDQDTFNKNHSWYAQHNPAKVEDPSELWHDAKGVPNIGYSQIRQFGTRDTPFSPDPLQWRRACDIVIDINKRCLGGFRMLTQGEAINGVRSVKDPLYQIVKPLDFSTIAGEYYSRRYNCKKKSDLFVNTSKSQIPYYEIADTQAGKELQERINKRLAYYQKGIGYTGFAKGCLKTELLPKRKVKIGKTRIFIAPDLDAVIVGRMLLGGYVGQGILNRDTFYTKLGIDPMTEFTTMYKQLSSVPGTPCAMDISRQDKNVAFEHREADAELFAELCTEPLLMSGWKDMFYAHNVSLVSSICIFEGELFQLPRGVLSGEVGTTSMDSNAVARSIVYSMLTKYPDMTARDFLANTSMNIFGDDFIVRSKFDLTEEEYIKGFAACGFKLEPIDKDKDGLELPFLSRELLYSPELDIVAPALKKKSILQPLFFVPSTSTEDVAQNWSGVLINAVLHGPVFFDNIRNDMRVIARRLPNGKDILAKLPQSDFDELLFIVTSHIKTGGSIAHFTSEQDDWCNRYMLDESKVSFKNILRPTYARKIKFISPFNNPSLYPQLFPKNGKMTSFYAGQDAPDFRKALKNTYYSRLAEKITPVFSIQESDGVFMVKCGSILCSGSRKTQTVRRAFIGYLQELRLQDDDNFWEVFYELEMVHHHKHQNFPKEGIIEILPSPDDPQPTSGCCVITKGKIRFPFGSTKSFMYDAKKRTLLNVAPVDPFEGSAEQHTLVAFAQIINSLLSEKGKVEISGQFPPKSGRVYCPHLTSVDISPWYAPAPDDPTLHVVPEDHRSKFIEHLEAEYRKLHVAMEAREQPIKVNGTPGMPMEGLNPSTSSGVVDRAPINATPGGGGDAIPQQGGPVSTAISDSSVVVPLIENKVSMMNETYQANQMVLAGPPLMGMFNKNVRTVPELSSMPIDAVQISITGDQARSAKFFTGAYGYDSQMLSVYQRLMIAMHQHYEGDLIVTVDQDANPMLQGATIWAEVLDVNSFGNVVDISEIQEMNWAIFNVNQKIAYSFTISDARSNLFFRRTSPGDLLTHPPPGIIGVIYHPIANQFGGPAPTLVSFVIRTRFSIMGTSDKPFCYFQPQPRSVLESMIAAAQGGDSQNPLSGRLVTDFLPGVEPAQYFFYTDGTGLFNEASRAYYTRALPTSPIGLGAQSTVTPSTNLTIYASNTGVNAYFTDGHVARIPAVLARDYPPDVIAAYISGNLATTDNYYVGNVTKNEVRIVASSGTMTVIQSTGSNIQITDPDASYLGIALTLTPSTAIPVAPLPQRWLRAIISSMPPTTVAATASLLPTATLDKFLQREFEAYLAGQPDSMLLQFELVDSGSSERVAVMRFDGVTGCTYLFSLGTVFGYQLAPADPAFLRFANVQLVPRNSAFQTTDTTLWSSRQTTRFRERLPQILLPDEDMQRVTPLESAKGVVSEPIRKNAAAAAIFSGIAGAGAGAANYQMAHQNQKWYSENQKAQSIYDSQYLAQAGNQQLALTQYQSRWSAALVNNQNKVAQEAAAWVRAHQAATQKNLLDQRLTFAGITPASARVNQSQSGRTGMASVFNTAEDFYVPPTTELPTISEPGEPPKLPSKPEPNEPHAIYETQGSHVPGPTGAPQYVQRPTGNITTSDNRPAAWFTGQPVPGGQSNSSNTSFSNPPGIGGVPRPSRPVSQSAPPTPSGGRPSANNTQAQQHPAQQSQASTPSLFGPNSWGGRPAQQPRAPHNRRLADTLAMDDRDDPLFKEFRSGFMRIPARDSGRSSIVSSSSSSSGRSTR